MTKQKEPDTLLKLLIRGVRSTTAPQPLEFLMPSTYQYALAYFTREMKKKRFNELEKRTRYFSFTAVKLHELKPLVIKKCLLLLDEKPRTNIFLGNDKKISHPSDYFFEFVECAVIKKFWKR